MLFRLKLDIKKLVNEILDQLPTDTWTSKTTTFLDPCMGGGQFVREIEYRLRRYGHSDENISGRVFGIESNKLGVVYARNKYKLAGTYSVGDFLETDFKDMRFDVVAGNPPFQRNDSPNSHSLWEKFLERSFDLVKENGYVSFVTPYIGRRKVQRFFHDNDVVSYCGIGVDRYFDVGSTFCWYVIRSGKHNIKTNIMTEAGVFVSEFPNLGFIPNNITKDNLEFLTTMTTGPKLPVRTDCGIHSVNKEKFSNNSNTKFKYPTQHTSSQTRYCSEAPKSLKMKKVICSKSGYLKPWYDNGTTGVTEGSWIIEVKSKKQADQVINFLNSDNVKRFIRLISSNTSANDPSLFKLLAFQFK